MIEVVSPYYITSQRWYLVREETKVYHIRNGIVNIILFFSKNIVAKSFMASTKLVSERLSEICVREKGLLFVKRMLVLIISTCSSVFHPSSVSHILWATWNVRAVWWFLINIQSKIQVWKQIFWCRGYYVDTVGRNQMIIAEYIQNQIQEDRVADQLTLFETVDLFTGEPNRKK